MIRLELAYATELLQLSGFNMEQRKLLAGFLADPAKGICSWEGKPPDAVCSRIVQPEKPKQELERVFPPIFALI